MPMNHTEFSSTTNLLFIDPEMRRVHSWSSIEVRILNVSIFASHLALDSFTLYRWRRFKITFNNTQSIPFYFFLLSLFTSCHSTLFLQTLDSGVQTCRQM